MRTTEASKSRNGNRRNDRPNIMASRRRSAHSSGKRTEITAGALLIVICSLGGLWLLTRADNTALVIALAVDLDRGEVIELEDLQLVQLGSDVPVNVLGEFDSGQVVDRVAMTDMAAGTLLTADHVTDGSTVELGEGLIGMTLNTGSYPSLSIRPGDVVDVVLTGNPAILEGSRDEILSAAAGQVLVKKAEVVEVAPVGSQGSLFVSLTMAETEAAMVAQAVDAGRVRLINVAGEGS